MRRRQTYIYYIAAIIIILFVISAMIQAVGSGEKRGSLKQQTESPLDKTGQEGEEQKALIPNPDIPNSNIRVLILSTGYQDAIHPEVTLVSDGGMKVFYGNENGKGQESAECKPGEALTIHPDDAGFKKGHIRAEALEAGQEIRIETIQRGYGTPSYGGVIELRTTAEGIAVINELPLEAYLCKVVPSEMPASYEMEALKAQAVCARSYACRQMADYGYPEYEAHVNDSTDYQVYNNSVPQERAAQAVHETEGQVVRNGAEIATTYYYSTSCGKTTSMEAWGTAPNEGNQYLTSVEVRGENGDYEKDLPWYRWTANIPVQTVSNLIGLHTQTDVGILDTVEVTKRGPGDIALQITATGGKGSVTVETENKIRSALGGGGYTITKNDGTAIESTPLLPSAFFTIERSGDQFIIQGGGFGHGIGMSQNGANEMAKQGKNYKEILTLFYQGVTVE